MEVCAKAFGGPIIFDNDGGIWTMFLIGRSLSARAEIVSSMNRRSSGIEEKKGGGHAR